MKSQIPGSVVTIRGQSGILDSLGVIALGVLLLCFAFGHLLRLVCGVLLIPVGFLMLWQSIPQIGKPLLVLYHEGFEVPRFGFIPWGAVQKINKHVPTARYTKMSPVLTFCVADLKSFKQQSQILMGQSTSNKQIQVILRHCKMEADDIMSVANQLWEECTGRDFTWNSSGSEEIDCKKFKNLELHAKELNDPKLRDEALQAIAELKSLQSNPIKASVKKVPQFRKQ